MITRTLPEHQYRRFTFPGRGKSFAIQQAISNRDAWRYHMRLLLLAAGILLMTLAKAQGTKNKFTVNRIQDGSDTLRTFTITGQEAASFMKAFAEFHNMEKARMPGTVQINNLSDAHISERFSMLVEDGIFTINSKGGTFAIFKTYDEREKKLSSALRSNQQRQVTVTLVKSGKNIVRSPVSEAATLVLLKEIMEED